MTMRWIIAIGCVGAMVTLFITWPLPVGLTLLVIALLLLQFEGARLFDWIEDTLDQRAEQRRRAALRRDYIDAATSMVRTADEFSYRTWSGYR